MGLKERERAGQLNGEELRIEKELAPVGYDEVLDSNFVEVKFGDPEVDAQRLLLLFTQLSTIEHLENIVPSPYTEIDPNTHQERIIPATTVDDIKEKYRDPSVTLLTAENRSGLIVGTCTVQKLSHNVAEVGRLVVARNYRRKHYGTMLIKAANALAFREDSGGLDCRLAQAFVIVSVPGYHIAQNAFRSQGFLGRSEREQSTRSWSNELGRLVDRNSQPMELTRRAYIQDFEGDHITYFPKLSLPKSA